MVQKIRIEKWMQIKQSRKLNYNIRDKNTNIENLNERGKRRMKKRRNEQVKRRGFKKCATSEEDFCVKWENAVTRCWNKK